MVEDAALFGAVVTTYQSNGKEEKVEKEVEEKAKKNLPDRLMVGHQVLVLGIGVRVPVGQRV